MKILVHFFLIILFFIQFLLYIGEEYKSQLVIFEISYVLLIIFTVRYNYLVSPISLFIIISFFYISAGPLDLHFFNNKDSLNSQTMGLMLLISYSFVEFLLLFWTLMGSKSFNISLISNLNSTLRNKSYSRLVYFTLSVLIILFVFIYIFKFILMYGFTIGGMSRGELFSDRSFILTLVKTALPVFIIAYLWLKKYYRNEKNTTLDYLVISLIIIFSLFDILFKGDRRVVVSLVVGIIGIYYLHKPLPKKYIISGLIGAISLYFYGAVRNRPLYMWSENLAYTLSKDFSPSSTEFGSFSLIANYLMKDEFFMLMPTLWSSFLSAIPGFIYPDRPLSSSLWFVKNYFTDIYMSGGGLAFNIIVDAVLNFGYFAPIVLSLFYMSFFVLGKQKGEIGVLISALLIYSLTFSARFDFAAIFQMVFYGWAMLAFVFLFALLFKKSKF